MARANLTERDINPTQVIIQEPRDEFLVEDDLQQNLATHTSFDNLDKQPKQETGQAEKEKSVTRSAKKVENLDSDSESDNEGHKKVSFKE